MWFHWVWVAIVFLVGVNVGLLIAVLADRAAMKRCLELGAIKLFGKHYRLVRYS